MVVKQPIFDTEKARKMIEKGKRSRWWKRSGSKSKNFRYTDAASKAIVDDNDLARIRSLVIPPAWKYVRISPFAGGRIQALGMDTTGRIQYLYHTKFSEQQKKKKFARIESFGKYLPNFRRITNEHIGLEGFPREKILAVMMRLINSLYIRVGSEKSSKHYKTYGITTLQNKHLEIGKKGKLIFEFVGKSHIKHRKVLVDEKLAEIFKELKALGRASKLFHYIDDEGKLRNIKSNDLNSYLKAATASEFTLKDFRTWGGTLFAAVELAKIGITADKEHSKKNITKAVKKVAQMLGNTPKVCRDSYIHPAIIKKYEAGITLDGFRHRKTRRISRIEAELEPEERALIKLFQDN